MINNKFPQSCKISILNHSIIRNFLVFIIFTIPINAKAQFGPQHDLSNATYGAYDAKSFDIDDDGDLDILSASWLDDKIVWFENDGFGGFSNQKIISISADGVKSIYAADLDGDGDLDILSASCNDDKIAWYTNNGTGIFSNEHIISTTSDSATCVHASDLDGDGDMDILVSSYNDDKIAWFINDGFGGFSSEQIISTAADGASCIYAIDLDSDGDIDVLSSSENDNKIAYYLNDGSGIFTSQQIISQLTQKAKSVYASDIDSDGDIDVLSASQNDNKIAWYINDGTANFSSQQIISNGANGAFSVYAADLDNDGDFDVLSASVTDDMIKWYENDGIGNFSSPTTIAVSVDGANSVYVGELNGDGNLDVLSASWSLESKVNWYENNGTGVFPIQHELSLSVANHSWVITSDIDGDGLIDILATSRENDLKWYKNLGNNDFSSAQMINNSIFLAPMAFAADLDGDGDIDVCTGQGNGTSSFKLIWHQNNGGGAFSAEQVIFISSSKYESVFPADLDNDGDIDILTTNLSGTTISWHENDGIGNFSTQQIISSVSWAMSGSAHDLDGDGDLDVLACFRNTDKVVWYINDGAGIFSTEQVITSSADGSYYATASDLDGDGDLDVISASQFDNKVAWYINNGSGTFSSPQVLSTSANNSSFVMAFDIDSDGDNDIFSGSSNEEKSSWYINNGTGNFSSEQIITATTGNSQSMSYGDFDGDGDYDLVASSLDGKLAWYENFYSSTFRFEGKVYYDQNQNGVLDLNEGGLNLIQTYIQPLNLINFTSDSGKFIHYLDTGFYNLTYTPNAIWDLTSDSSSYSRSVNSLTPLIDSLNFGFYPNTLITDIQADLTGGFPRCDTLIKYWVSLTNFGTSLPSGIIDLQLDDSITFVSSVFPPDSVVNQHIYWHFDSIFCFEQLSINLIVQTPSFNNMGDTLISTVAVHELNSSNVVVYSNIDSLSQVLLCSYDPNDKSVTPKGFGDLGFILSSETELEYLIRFQNTGNDTAYTINIRDQLASNLDWNSLQPISSSHPMQTWIEQDGELVFQFANIFLPDSSTNELGSQGFVKFKINLLPNLPIGSQVLNTGYIYFDNNPAIVTNTVVNTIYECPDSIGVSLDSILCFGESLIAIADQDHFSSFSWNLGSFSYGFNNSYTWVSDTAGIFDLFLEVENQICTRDTLINIVVYPMYNHIDTISICMGDSVLISGSYQNSTGLFSDSLQTIYGCDSIFTTYLVVNDNFLSNQTISICQGDSVLISSNYEAISGTYYDSLQSIYGCDSIFITTLVVFDNFVANHEISICEGDSVLINSEYENENGIYYDSLQTFFGCDSVNIIFLTVNNVNTSLNINDPIISANAIGGIFNWLDCNSNYSPISGAQSNVFIPFQNGYYAVEITQNNCVDTSECITISTVGLNQFDTFEQFSIIPNPSSGIFNIDLGKRKNISILIYNSVGAKVFEDYHINYSNYHFELNETPGIYFIEILHNGNKEEFKVILY